jgi:type IV pilus biogenesis protein CpaD/CtpE
MKKLYLAGKAVLALALVLSGASCSTTGMKVTLQTDDGGARFADEGAVNAVLQFSSWDYTFLVRPQYTEDGFLQKVQRENLDGILGRLHVRRGLAVVVVGWTYNGDTLTRIVADWKKILGGCGFQRVVVLRAQLGNRLNGSVIVDDSTLHLGSVESASRGG